MERQTRSGDSLGVSMDPHEDFFKSLPREDLQLLALCEILYEGSWEELVEDLKARKSGRPFVYKLQARIEEDLGRIDRLRAYEDQHGVSLRKYVSLDSLAAGKSSAR
jgi:hypothetical protein